MQEDMPKINFLLIRTLKTFINLHLIYQEEENNQYFKVSIIKKYTFYFFLNLLTII